MGTSRNKIHHEFLTMRNYKAHRTTRQLLRKINNNKAHCSVEILCLVTLP